MYLYEIFHHNIMSLVAASYIVLCTSCTNKDLITSKAYESVERRAYNIIPFSLKYKTFIGFIMSTDEYCICFEDVQDAYENIKTRVNMTPVLTSSSLSNLSCSNLFFKCEAFQKTGSFKFRGAMNAVINLCRQNESDEKHVVTHSSGNHAAALALAARLAPHQNMKATIVMPENAPLIKVNGVKGFGGDIVFVESTNQARETKADEIVLEQKAYFVVSYM